MDEKKCTCEIEDIIEWEETPTGKIPNLTINITYNDNRDKSTYVDNVNMLDSEIEE